MKSTTSYIIALSLFLFFGCLSGPNSSRINERDPESKHFKPIFSNLNIRASTTEKKIIVSWRNRSNYNEGFIVNRRYSSKDKFEPVDTLSTNSYIEMVTNYSMGMEFQVSSYYLWNNKIRLGESQKTEDINFGTLANIGYFSGASSDTVIVQ